MIVTCCDYLLISLDWLLASICVLVSVQESIVVLSRQGMCMTVHLCSLLILHLYLCCYSVTWLKDSVIKLHHMLMGLLLDHIENNRDVFWRITVIHYSTCNATCLWIPYSYDTHCAVTTVTIVWLQTFGLFLAIVDLH